MPVDYSTKIRPRKPYPEFPLFPHNNGQWARKIKGKLKCFGSWDDPVAALKRHNHQYPYLKSGLDAPEDVTPGVTIKEVCDTFLANKEADHKAGQISERWVKDLHNAALIVANTLGRGRSVESLGPQDFHKLRIAIVGKHSPAIAKNHISRIRSIFEFAYKNRIIDRPVNYGTMFRPPSRDLIRKHRNRQPKKLWQPSQVRQLLAEATPTLRAMIYLGINCGVDCSDLCNLPIGAVNLKTGWLDYPRAKTGIERRVKLWPETVEALRDYLAIRPKPPKRLERNFFVTVHLNKWTASSIVHEFAKLRDKCEIESGTFIWFRKTVQTIGENEGDTIAVKAVMGHVDDSISSEYRQGVDPRRIVRVTEIIHDWLINGGAA
jgi:integrase